jgi:PAS domain S-box-containing protein
MNDQTNRSRGLQKWARVGFIALLLLLVSMGLAAYGGFQKMQVERQQMYATHKLLGKFDRFLSQLQAMEYEWQDYLMTGADTDRFAYQQHYQNSYAALFDLKQTAPATLHPALTQVEQDIDAYFQGIDRSLITLQSTATQNIPSTSSNAKLPNLIQLIQQNHQRQHLIQAKLKTISQQEFEKLQRHLAVTDRPVQQLFAAMILFCLLSVVLLIISYSLLKRQIRLLQKISQQRQRDSQSQFSHILDRISDAFVSIDRHWNYTYLNPKAGLLLMRDPQALIGKNLWDDFPEKLGEPFYHICHDAMETRSFRQLEEYEADINRWFDNRIYPTPDGLSIFFQDITDRKQMELALRQHEQHLEQQVAQRTAELQTLNQELLRSNHELETYAYVTSHDLREPLRAIVVYTQLLQEEAETYQFDPSALECMHYIVDGATRMQQLIQDLLSYSRAGTQDLVRSPVNVNDLLDEILRSLQVAITESNAIVESEPLPILYVDETQLKQLLQNLIDNAIKFHGQLNPQVSIKVKLVEATLEAKTWQFSVKDNGIGIKEPFLDRIFDIFRRLNSREKFAGTGIGLAICKKIVERHQGKIWVESQFGQGTTVHFTLVEPIQIDELNQ